VTERPDQAPDQVPDQAPDDTPKFGRLLALLAFGVLLVVLITFGSEAYFS
jgi:hypothetical protein